MDRQTNTTAQDEGRDRAPLGKRQWVSPEIVELPRLTDLTLQTGSPIDGIGNPGSGSTVF